MSRKNSKSSGKESLTKVDFKKHLIVVGIVIVLIFIFAVVYSSYEGNIAGEASGKSKKSSSGSTERPSVTAKRMTDAATAAGVDPTTVDQNSRDAQETAKVQAANKKVEDCKTAATASGADPSTC